MYVKAQRARRRELTLAPRSAEPSMQPHHTSPIGSRGRRRERRRRRGRRVRIVSPIFPGDAILGAPGGVLQAGGQRQFSRVWATGPQWGLSRSGGERRVRGWYWVVLGLQVVADGHKRSGDGALREGGWRGEVERQWESSGRRTEFGDDHGREVPKWKWMKPKIDAEYHGER